MRFVKSGSPRRTFTLVHISDFHLCRPAGIGFSRLLNKRAFSYLSWKIRRRHGHRTAVLRALTQAVQATGFFESQRLRR